MKKIVVIGATVAMALSSVGFAQEATAPQPVASAQATAGDAKKIAAEFMGFMKEAFGIIFTVKDKATADAAAVKLKDLDARTKDLKGKLEAVPPAELNSALEEYGEEFMGIAIGGFMFLEQLKQADYHGSADFKEALKIIDVQTKPAEPAPQEKQ